MQPGFETPESIGNLGFDPQVYPPDSLLTDDKFPLDTLETNPQDKYEAWNRPDLRSFTEAIGSAWEEYLAERYPMELVRQGPCRSTCR
jgi:hypothetical protein